MNHIVFGKNLVHHYLIDAGQQVTSIDPFISLLHQGFR